MLFFFLLIAVAYARHFCDKPLYRNCSSPTIDSCMLIDELNTTLFAFKGDDEPVTYLKVKHSSNSTVFAVSCPDGGTNVYLSNNTKDLGIQAQCYSPSNNSALCLLPASNFSRFLRFNPVDECSCNHLTVWLLP